MIEFHEYISAIEKRFEERRGQLALLSPQDWTLVNNWYQAGIALETALGGIDQAFAAFKRCAKPGSKINGLNWCDSTVRALDKQATDSATQIRGRSSL